MNNAPWGAIGLAGALLLSGCASTASHVVTMDAPREQRQETFAKDLEECRAIATQVADRYVAEQTQGTNTQAIAESALGGAGTAGLLGSALGMAISGAASSALKWGLVGAAVGGVVGAFQGSQLTLSPSQRTLALRKFQVQHKDCMEQRGHAVALTPPGEQAPPGYKLPPVFKPHRSRVSAHASSNPATQREDP